jgi:hypothetical protein
LTQYVETTFKYSFSGDNPADISGQYEIDAKLTGYILVEDKQSSETVKRRVKAWEKIYPLIPATPFSRHDQKFGIKQVIPVDLRSYAAFADQVAKELKFSADIIELSITYHVLGSASTSQGKISEPVETILSIPVEGNSFIVNGKLADEKENSITIPGTESVPGVKTARTGWVVTTALLAILLLLIIFNTKAKAESPSERELRMIIKKHGDRIVAGVFSFTSVHDKNTTVLNSFYDLVKVADEVAQPILYENASDNLHSFYVINEPMIFSYSLEINTNENVYNNSQVITGS